MKTLSEIQSKAPPAPPAEPVRLLLGPEESEIIAELGTCLAIVSPASHPDPPSRYALHLIPCDVAALDKATRVALGTLGTRRLAKK